MNSDLKLSWIAVCAADLAKVRIGEVGVRVGVVRSVGEIEGVELDGYLHRLVECL